MQILSLQIHAMAQMFFFILMPQECKMAENIPNAVNCNGGIKIFNSASGSILDGTEDYKSNHRLVVLGCNLQQFCSNFAAHLINCAKNNFWAN